MPGQGADLEGPMIAVPDTSLPDADDMFWLFIGLAATSCYAIENADIAARRPDGSDAFTVLFGYRR